MTQPHRTLTTAWGTRSARLAGAVLCLLMVAPSVGAQIPGFGVTKITGEDGFEFNTDRFPTTGASSTRYINLEDCPDYLGQTIEIDMSLSLSESSSFSIKMAGPGQSCAQDTDDDDANCKVLVTDTKSPTETSQSVTIELDELMFGDEVPNCDNMLEDTTTIYVIAQGTVDTSILVSEIEIDIDLDPPSAPEVTAVGSGDTLLTVTWDDSSNDANKDRTFKVYWSTSPIDETNKDNVNSQNIGTATTFDIEDNLDNGTTYYVAVTAIDEADNESSLSNVDTGIPQPSTDFWEGYQAAGGSDTGGFCFIATVSYGAPMAAELGTLRAFRDQVLLPTAAGQRFVADYYTWGRFAAAWISDKPALKWIARVLLAPLVWFADVALATSFGWALLIFGLGLWLMIALTRRVWRWRKRDLSTQRPSLEGAQ